MSSILNKLSPTKAKYAAITKIGRIEADVNGNLVIANHLIKFVDVFIFTLTSFSITSVTPQ